MCHFTLTVSPHYLIKLKATLKQPTTSRSALSDQLFLTFTKLSSVHLLHRLFQFVRKFFQQYIITETLFHDQYFIIKLNIFNFNM